MYKKIWILNVGDIKPAEYQIELFMYMAWDIAGVAREGVNGHLAHFLKREFGESAAGDLLPVMQEHYRLAHIRKPEHMGNTRTEESDDRAIVADLPWSKEYILRRIDDYQSIYGKVEQLFQLIPSERQDAYFQLVKYPVQAAAEMNKKMLFAQLARHGEMDWSRSDAAYDSIVALTRLYNNGINNDGKWQRMKDCQPRRLAVFKQVGRTTATAPLPQERTCLHSWNATECAAGNPSPCEGLGYESKAAIVPSGETLAFDFPHPLAVLDSSRWKCGCCPRIPWKAMIYASPSRWTKNSCKWCRTPPKAVAKSGKKTSLGIAPSAAYASPSAGTFSTIASL